MPERGGINAGSGCGRVSSGAAISGGAGASESAASTRSAGGNNAGRGSLGTCQRSRRHQRFSRRYQHWSCGRQKRATILPPLLLQFRDCETGAARSTPVHPIAAAAGI